MYNFDEIINRKNTNCVKWDVFPDSLPLWVADMDFAVLPEIQEAIQKRAAHPIYGYSIMPKGWTDAYRNWWGKRYGLAIGSHELLFCAGVVPGIVSMIRTFSNPGDSVVVISPNYNHFFSAVELNGRNVEECPLTYLPGGNGNTVPDLYGDNSSGPHYELDYGRLETCLKKPESKLLIFCNPQNPSGNLWTAEEMAKVGELCKLYNVLVISDEIHCDITAPGVTYTPFASVNETCRMNSVSCFAPSKTFNIAGFQSAALYVANPEIYKKVSEGLKRDEVWEGNVFAADTAIAAYTYGETWVDEMRAYVARNRAYAEDFIATHLQELRVVHSDATYLMWVDCSKIFARGENPSEYLMKHANVFFSEGGIYRGGGDLFLRMNLACPRKTLEEAMRRLENGIRTVVPE